jgi:hypothetical protein
MILPSQSLKTHRVSTCVVDVRIKINMKRAKPRFKKKNLPQSSENLTLG